MLKSELVTAQHLTRKAVIYIRQSTPHQQLSNQESLRLQYALKQRAISLGWSESDIEVIDADLGLSGAAAQHREGFKEMLAKVTLGQVGIILSYEVTRLCRNCSDWYPLLDICGYKGCLIADADGIYDSATPNGRMLLGLKGQISELELHTIRTRLTAGLINKAQRGELALKLPIGLVRDGAGQVRKDPNVEVQSRLELVFHTFLQRRSACKVLRFLNEQKLCLPRYDQHGDLVWKKPTVAAILSTLKNPAYAGAFVYGRTRSVRQEAHKVSLHKLPLEQWKVVVKDKYPAYIAWDTFEQIRAMLQDNYAQYDRNKSRGIPRDGEAMLHGLVYCGECGHKMVVQYKAGARYICNYLRQQHGVPVCQYIPTAPVDAVVIKAFLAAVSPIELDAYARAVERQQQLDDKIAHAQQQQIQRLEYQANLARRQFGKVDPDNRLVAAELEKRWEAALRELKTAQATTLPNLQHQLPELAPEIKALFVDIGQRLPQIWETPMLSNATKKALLRCLLDKVVIHRCTWDQVQIRIVWKGGATSTSLTPIAVKAVAQLSSGKQLEEQILALHAQGHSDQAIAQELTVRGYRSPMRTVVLASTVQIIRLRHGRLITRHQAHPRHIPGSLTVPALSKLLDIPRHWIYDRIHNGCIQIAKDATTGLYLFPDRPATLTQLKKLHSGRLSQLSFS
jgi:DNA invertase Pin-like site-specific DNA recombinase